MKQTRLIACTLAFALVFSMFSGAQAALATNAMTEESQNTVQTTEETADTQTHTDTAMNATLYSSSPAQLSINSSDTYIEVPRDLMPSRSATFTAKVKDESDSIIPNCEVFWSISPADIDGISMDHVTGVLTVENDAKHYITDTVGQTFTVSAKVLKADHTYLIKTQNIQIKREPSSIRRVEIYTDPTYTEKVSVAEAVPIPDTGLPANTKKYYAQSIDQYGEAKTESDYYWTPRATYRGLSVSYIKNEVTVSIDSSAIATNAEIQVVGLDSGVGSSIKINISNLRVDWSGIALQNPQTSGATPTFTYGTTKRAAFQKWPANNQGTATSKGQILKGTFSIDNQDVLLQAGSNQTIAVSFTIDDPGNLSGYDGFVITKLYTLHILPKQISMEITPLTREYGKANTDFSYTISDTDLVTGDTKDDLGITVSTHAAIGDVPGTYDAVVTCANPNYVLSVDTANKLTITKAQLTWSAPTLSFSPILANDPLNQSQQALLGAVATQYPTFTVSYHSGTMTLDAAWSWDSLVPFNPAGGVYTLTANPVLPPDQQALFTCENVTATLSVTVTPLTGAVTYPSNAIYASTADVGSAAVLSDLGIPEDILISFGGVIADETFPITQWRIDRVLYTTGDLLTYLKNLDSSMDDQTVTLVPELSFPAWISIDPTLQLSTMFIKTEKTPATVSFLSLPLDMTYGDTLITPVAQVSVGIPHEWKFIYKGVSTAGTVYESTTPPVNAGTYTVTAMLISETHSGSATSASFEIRPKALDTSMLSEDFETSYYYTGAEIVPTVSLCDMQGSENLISSDDYTYTLSDHIAVGQATLTITATAGGNYSGSILLHFDIEKAPAPQIPHILKEYEIPATTQAAISLDSYLPAHLGTATYTIESFTAQATANHTISPEGVLAFDITGDASASDEIPITITSQNYEDIELVIVITLSNKEQPQGTVSVLGTITYGQSLSVLTLSGKFLDSNGDTVPGILSWTDAAYQPEGGQSTQEWTFTPNDLTRYISVTGHETIRVKKAVPQGAVSCTKINKSGYFLQDIALIGADTFQNPLDATISIPGTLSWDASVNIAVSQNMSYTWTFTPDASVAKNYTVATGALVPWVSSSTSGPSGGGTGGNIPSTTPTPAPTPTPSTSPTTSPEATIQTPSTQDGVTTVAVKLSSKTTGSTTEAAIDHASMTLALSRLKEASTQSNTVSTLSLSVSVPSSANTVQIQLPKSGLYEVIQSKIHSLKISTQLCDITLPQDVLVSMYETASGNDITLGIDIANTPATGSAVSKTIINLYAFSNNGSQALSCTSQSGIKVSLPFSMPSLYQTSDIAVYEMRSAGLSNLSKVRNVHYDATLKMLTFEMSAITYCVITIGAGTDDIVWNNPFIDVTQSDWFFDAVRYCDENNLIQGIDTSRFAPTGLTTRSMIVTMLWRLEGQPTAPQSNFVDIPEGEWYEKAVSWAAACGIVEGYGEGIFDPDAPITRLQMVTIFYRYATQKGVSVQSTVSLEAFSDASDLPDWGIPPVQWAVGVGLLKGNDDGTIAMDDYSQRAQVATIMQRLMEAVLS